MAAEGGFPGPEVVARLLQDEGAHGQLAGAALACSEIVYDPGQGEALFDAGGWEPADAADEGTTEYWSPAGLWVMFWREPGFCMVETDAMGTADALAVLLAAAEGWPGLRVEDAGDDCTVVDLGQGTVVQLTGPGQDPVCDDPGGAALRFAIADQ